MPRRGPLTGARGSLRLSLSAERLSRLARPIQESYFMGSQDVSPGSPPASNRPAASGPDYPSITRHSAQRLLWAGFFSIFAAGVGFGVRGGILVDWAREYGFTQAELGAISGGGLAGFGFIILFGSLIADKIGYGTLMGFAFLMHV